MFTSARRFCLIFTFWLWAVSLVVGNENRPNILWITCEDLSPRLGCYGDQTVATPNIDQLAEQGVRYTHAFGVFGVCAPNRHCLIMGMYPNTTGAMHMRTWKRSKANDEGVNADSNTRPLYEAVPPPNAKCFTEYLRAAGYFCTNNAKTDYQFRPPITAWDHSGKQAHWRKRPDKNAPFFSVFNFTVTHESGTFKQRSKKVTDPGKVPLPAYYPDTPLVRRDIARHYDNIVALDQKVGKLLTELKEDGLDRNTIVFFFSDHGDGLPRAKRWVYDSGIRVPLLVRWADGKKAATVNNDLISFVDFAPTVLSLAGVEIPAHMQGQVFLGANKSAPRKYIFASRDRMDQAPETIRAVRDHRYKYIRNYRPKLPYFGHLPYRNRAAIAQEILRLDREGGLGPDQWQLYTKTKPKEELYDCQTDPEEIRNRIGDPELKEKLMELRSAHEQWMRKVDHFGHISESELVEVLWPPNGVQPVTADPVFEFSFNGNQDLFRVNINCATEGASIAYRRNDQARWSLFTEPFTAPAGAKITTRAHRIGFKPSSDVSANVK